MEYRKELTWVGVPYLYNMWLGLSDRNCWECTSHAATTCGYVRLSPGAWDGYYLGHRYIWAQHNPTKEMPRVRCGICL